MLQALHALQFLRNTLILSWSCRAMTGEMIQFHERITAEVKSGTGSVVEMTSWWGTLRSAFSHAPPQPWSPSGSLQIYEPQITAASSSTSLIIHWPSWCLKQLIRRCLMGSNDREQPHTHPHADMYRLIDLLSWQQSSASFLGLFFKTGAVFMSRSKPKPQCIFTACCKFFNLAWRPTTELRFLFEDTPFFD